MLKRCKNRIRDERNEFDARNPRIVKKDFNNFKV